MSAHREHKVIRIIAGDKVRGEGHLVQSVAMAGKLENTAGNFREGKHVSHQDYFHERSL